MFSDACPPLLFAERTLGELDHRSRYIVYTELTLGLGETLPLWECALEQPNPMPPAPLMAWPNWVHVMAVPRAQRPRTLKECIALGGQLCQRRADDTLADLVRSQGRYRAARTIGISGTTLNRRLAARHEAFIVR